MELAGEAVVRVDDKLQRVHGGNGERVHLQSADLGNPEEAVFSRACANGGLLEDDASATVGERVDGCVVVEAVEYDANESQNAVRNPDTSSDSRDYDDLLAKFRLVKADENHRNCEEGHVKNVEEFIVPQSHDSSGEHKRKEGEPGGDAVDFFGNTKACHVTSLDEVGGVCGTVDNDENHGDVPGDLVENIQPLVRPSGQEAERSVLQAEEDHESDVGDGQPIEDQFLVVPMLLGFGALLNLPSRTSRDDCEIGKGGGVNVSE